MTVSRPLTLVDDPSALRELCARLEDAEVAALDTESNGMHAYRERVCLLQISVPDADFVIDPLAVDPAPLGTWLGDPRRVKVLHAADNDVRVLGRDFDLRLVNLFDTMLAARALAWPAKGLGDILSARFGCRTDKRWQKHDWSTRPLRTDALEYARNDTCHLAALRELQLLELEAAGVVEELEHACVRMSELVARPRVFDPSAWAGIDGARKLDDAARSVLAALFALRERLAESMDRAPYRVLGESVLLELARTQPKTRRELLAVRGVGGPVAHRHAQVVLDEIARAQKDPPPPWPVPPPRPDKALRARFDALRDWRRAHATTRKLEPDMILGKDAMTRIAELGPADHEALATCGVLDAWELERYGAAILDALRRVAT
jgi:ribonuclease D